jgi:hypothetical protein
VAIWLIRIGMTQILLFSNLEAEDGTDLLLEDGSFILMEANN